MVANAFSFLNDLAQWLGRWIPRLVLIEASHRGVLFGPRGGVKEAGPGLVCYWPITHNLVRVAVTTQSVQLYSQMLPTDVDQSRIVPLARFVAAAVQFRIVRPALAVVQVLSVHALIDNRTQAAIARHAGAHPDSVAWASAVVADLRYELQPFGVSVDRLDFTQNGTGVALKNLQDWAYSDNAEGKRPE